MRRVLVVGGALGAADGVVDHRDAGRRAGVVAEADALEIDEAGGRDARGVEDGVVVVEAAHVFGVPAGEAVVEVGAGDVAARRLFKLRQVGVAEGNHLRAAEFLPAAVVHATHETETDDCNFFHAHIIPHRRAV